MSHDGRRSKGSPDRAASLGSLGPHARPCPDDRHARAVGSFRNNSVPEDESHAKLRSNPAQRRDHHQELTDKIIVALEAGTAPWRRPWDKTACGGATAPVNAPQAIATVASISSCSECRRSLSRPTTHAGALTAWPARAAGRSARARKRRRFISTSRSRSRTKRATADRRLDASRCCVPSRSFTPPRSMESLSLRLRSRRRLWPSGWSAPTARTRTPKFTPPFHPIRRSEDRGSMHPSQPR
jgi:hypothetical protein